MRTKKRSDTSPTVNIVGCDPVLCERIRASLGRSPFHFRTTDAPLECDEVDLFVIPALEIADRAQSGVPVIAHGPAGLMRGAFLAGCADYLRDPWTPEELALRVLAAFSRQRACYEFPWGEARFQGDAFCTPRGAAPLTRREATLLRALLRRRGQPVTRAALASLLGTAPRGPGSRRVDVHISAVRQRVKAVVPEAGRFIVCVRGQGYMVP